LQIFDKITVIIPTHERHNFLERSLDYWSQLDIKIIVIDSSVDKYTGQVLENIVYFHYPDKSFVEKIAKVLSQIETDYSAICADDDFITETGILESLIYLDSNEKFVSAQGRYIAFWFNEQESIDFSPRYAGARNYEVSHDDANERMNLSMSPYMHQFYAVQKTKILKEAFSVCVKHNYMRGWELDVSLIASIYGNHKTLPVFYGAREAMEQSKQIGFVPLIADWVNNPDNQTELNMWRDAIAEVYSKHEGVGIDEGRRAFDKAINSYIYKSSSFTMINSSIAFKELIKKFIPNSILRMKRKIVYGKKQWPPSSRQASILRKTVSKEPGYPLSDKTARKEWMSMKNIINKHGLLDNIVYRDHL